MPNVDHLQRKTWISHTWLAAFWLLVFVLNVGPSWEKFATARELIAAHLSQLDQFELAASCRSAIEASRVLQEQSIDLMFLDIEMPVLKGTDFYKNLARKPPVIFTTAYRDYAVDGFDLDAVDYLLKPIVFARFFQAIERFLAARGSRPSSNVEPGTRPATSKHLFVRVDRKDVRIAQADICYIQGHKDYLKIQLSEGSCITKQTLAAFHSQLSDDFVRVHRSYIVNRQKISAITAHDVEIGAVEIPIGESYRATAAQLLTG